MGTPPEHCKEIRHGDKDKSSLFEYYKVKAETSDIIYLFVSTSTAYNGMLSDFRLMQTHANDSLKVGLISNQSSMFKTFVKVGLIYDN